MSTENPNQEKPKSDSPNRTSNQQDNRSNPQVTPAPRPAESYPPQPPQGHGVPCKTKRDWHDYAMLFVQGVGVIFLIAYTTFAALQWCEMKRAAKAAEGANIAARDALVTSNRPWVGVSINSVKVLEPLRFDEPRANVTIQFQIKNVGTSPAIETQTTSALLFYSEGPSPAERIGCSKQKSKGAGIILLSGDAFTAMPIKAVNMDGGVKTSSVGTVSAYLIICSNYDDQWGNTHATGQAWLYLPKAENGLAALRPKGIVQGEFRAVGEGAKAF